jgi:hypothetical protein
MPTQLTTPEVRVAVTTATVDSLGIDVVRKSDLTVDATQTIFAAKVTLRDGTGKELDTRTLRRAAVDLPAGLRTKIADLHVALIAALKAANVLPAGTDTADF